MEGVIGFTTLFAGNFAPKSWAFCQGQTINIASNTALFSILGTQFGGNGTTNFKLPDLQGRTIVGAGQGPGLSAYSIGQTGGLETTTMSPNQMPSHIHPVQITARNLASSNDATDSTANNSVYARDAANFSYATSPTANGGTFMATLNTGSQGFGAPFEISRPFLAMNYIICQYGVFPARN